VEISLIIRTPGTVPHQYERIQDFIQSAVGQGHEIRQCFFQGAGVSAALTDQTLPRWRQLATLTGAELLLCSQAVEASALSVPEPFVVAGLGALVEAAVNADRLVSFV
jgi:sulfur relay (sulfurtransferase) complex TusBCD TusD component (DsrE family)